MSTVRFLVFRSFLFLSAMAGAMALLAVTIRVVGFSSIPAAKVLYVEVSK